MRRIGALGLVALMGSLIGALALSARAQPWEEKARTPWPTLPEDEERALWGALDGLSEEALQSWALDRALPLLGGALEAPPEVLERLVATLAGAVPEASREEAAALMAEARRFYAEGALEAAEQAYGRVRRGSTFWPAALRERAWALYRLARPDEALGASISLRSPWFRLESHAEAALLEAAVLLSRCREEEARARVEPLLSEERSGAEGPLLERARAAWGQAPERADLKALVAKLEAEEGVALQARSEALRRRVLSLRYESLRSEREALEAGRGEGALRATPRAPLGDDEIAWDFDGRWWRDELGTYRYSAADACDRTGAGL